MLALLAALLLSPAPAPADQPKTYLASIVRLPMKSSERLSAFAIDTWGVEFKAVCHLPAGWWIKAGGAATPDGWLAGQGSHGVTWIYGDNAALRDLVLITLDGPIQKVADKSETGGVPATFTGRATVEGLDNTRHRPLSWRNIQLTPARRCPSAR